MTGQQSFCNLRQSAWRDFPRPPQALVSSLGAVVIHAPHTHRRRRRRAWLPSGFCALWHFPAPAVGLEDTLSALEDLLWSLFVLCIVRRPSPMLSTYGHIKAPVHCPRYLPKQADCQLVRRTCEIPACPNAWSRNGPHQKNAFCSSALLCCSECVRASCSCSHSVISFSLRFFSSRFSRTTKATLQMDVTSY